MSEHLDIPGIATGLAVTAVGGDILFIEATRMTGNDVCMLTGQLGDVMREAPAFRTVMCVPKDDFQLTRSFSPGRICMYTFQPVRFPKTAASAGVAMVAAITSLLDQAPGAPRCWDDRSDYPAWAPGRFFLSVA